MMMEQPKNRWTDIQRSEKAKLFVVSKGKPARSWLHVVLIKFRLLEGRDTVLLSVSESHMIPDNVQLANTHVGTFIILIYFTYLQ